MAGKSATKIHSPKRPSVKKPASPKGVRKAKGKAAPKAKVAKQVTLDRHVLRLEKNIKEEYGVVVDYNPHKGLVAASCCSYIYIYMYTHTHSERNYIYTIFTIVTSSWGSLLVVSMNQSAFQNCCVGQMALVRQPKPNDWFQRGGGANGETLQTWFFFIRDV
jgi:hypothetical protein